MPQIVVAQYTSYGVFKIPKEFEDWPLDCIEVLYTKLFVYSKECPRTVLCELDPVHDPEDSMDWKRPTYEYGNAEEYGVESEDEDVDDHDSPNIFPYKLCHGCDERNSTGNYDLNREWRCEDCPAAAESEESENKEEDKDEASQSN